MIYKLVVQRAPLALTGVGILLGAACSAQVPTPSTRAQISNEQVPAIRESSDAGRNFARDRSRLAPHNRFASRPAEPGRGSVVEPGRG